MKQSERCSAPPNEPALERPKTIRISLEAPDLDGFDTVHHALVELWDNSTIMEAVDGE